MSYPENPDMSPDEFVEIGRLLWGKNWKKQMAFLLKKNRTSIYRYSAGISNIDGFVAGSLRAFERTFKETGKLPNILKESFHANRSRNI